MSEAQIPIIDQGFLWCSCDTQIPECVIPDACPSCGRETAGLLEEAAYNAKVMAFVESKPLDWGLPEIGESKVDTWARWAAAYEQERQGDTR